MLIISTEKYYFYPRPPRGGRRGSPVAHGGRGRISIHALREEGDCSFRELSAFFQRFLSTPSARRATKKRKYLLTTTQISIHALREEGDHPVRTQAHRRRHISIHALREEGDALGIPGASTFKPISIHALREEGDVFFVPGSVRLLISIHALREEGDIPASTCPALRTYFYPRPPRGGRQQKQRQNLYFLINYTTFCTNLEEP